MRDESKEVRLLNYRETSLQCCAWFLKQEKREESIKLLWFLVMKLMDEVAVCDNAITKSASLQPLVYQGSCM